MRPARYQVGQVCVQLPAIFREMKPLLFFFDACIFRALPRPGNYSRGSVGRPSTKLSPRIRAVNKIRSNLTLVGSIWMHHACPHCADVGMPTAWQICLKLCVADQRLRRRRFVSVQCVRSRQQQQYKYG